MATCMGHSMVGVDQGTRSSLSLFVTQRSQPRASRRFFWKHQSGEPEMYMRPVSRSRTEQSPDSPDCERPHLLSRRVPRATSSFHMRSLGLAKSSL